MEHAITHQVPPCPPSRPGRPRRIWIPILALLTCADPHRPLLRLPSADVFPGPAQVFDIWEFSYLVVTGSLLRACSAGSLLLSGFFRLASLGIAGDTHRSRRGRRVGGRLRSSGSPASPAA